MPDLFTRFEDAYRLTLLLDLMSRSGKLLRITSPSTMSSLAGEYRWLVEYGDTIYHQDDLKDAVEGAWRTEMKAEAHLDA